MRNASAKEIIQLSSKHNKDLDRNTDIPPAKQEILREYFNTCLAADKEGRFTHTWGTCPRRTLTLRTSTYQSMSKYVRSRLHTSKCTRFIAGNGPFDGFMFCGHSGNCCLRFVFDYLNLLSYLALLA